MKKYCTTFEHVTLSSSPICGCALRAALSQHFQHKVYPARIRQRSWKACEKEALSTQLFVPIDALLSRSTFYLLYGVLPAFLHSRAIAQPLVSAHPGNLYMGFETFQDAKTRLRKITLTQ